ncbi:MAG: hypothetical protein IPL75_13595 [Acidobacteria bacterium]|nr:hypothetical protein [Acidobacteriota bacterium]
MTNVALRNLVAQPRHPLRARECAGSGQSSEVHGIFTMPFSILGSWNLKLLADERSHSKFQ